MPEPTPEQIAKLPRWAQDYIHSLRQDVSESRDIAEAASFSQSAGQPSNTFLNRLGRFMSNRPPIYLPNNERITFALGTDHESIEQETIDVYVSDGYGDGDNHFPVLTIHGYRGLVMLPPRSSNLIEFRLEKH